MITDLRGPSYGHGFYLTVNLFIFNAFTPRMSLRRLGLWTVEPFVPSGRDAPRSMAAAVRIKRVLVSQLPLRVQPVSATPLVVYRLAFGSPRSFAGVD